LWVLLLSFCEFHFTPDIECVITRPLNTGEAFADRAIINNTFPTKLVFAHAVPGAAASGSSPSWSWYHNSNRWPVSIDLFNPTSRVAEILAMPDYHSSTLYATNG
jgi:hypothetical protein